MATRPLVSVMMPAYDRPELTRRALQSALEQEYRPLEVVLSDNGSPTSLEPVVNSLRGFEDDQCSIRYYRQPYNLGLGDNYAFLIDQLKGKYAVSLNNDDWYTDRRFLVDAVEVMEDLPDCYLSVANSEIENSGGVLMINLPPELEARDRYRTLPGDAYIRLYGPGGIGAQSYAAVVFNVAVARSLGVMRYPFNVPGWLEREADLLGDEGFALQFLLASLGTVAVTGRVVSVRGMPAESYSKSERWRRDCNHALFIIYYNLCHARLNGRYAAAVKTRAREMLFKHAVDSINLHILRHYRYAPRAVATMLLSWLWYCAQYYVRNVRRIGRVVMHRDSSDRQVILARIKARGLLRSLFPFIQR